MQNAMQKGDNHMFNTNVVDHATVKNNYQNDSDIRMMIASKMIDRDYPVAEIAKITDLTIGEVENLK